MAFITDYRPSYDDPTWVAARAALVASDIRIAQIDTGLFAHPALGFGAAGQPPAHILLQHGRNVFDPQTSPFGTQPLTDLTKATDFVGARIEWPDHGVKTLGVILSGTDQFRGVCPGAKVIPFRAANGPVMRRGLADLQTNIHATARIGQAIELALALAIPPRVITISMGNPGFLPWEFARLALNGSTGIAKSTAKAIDRAYLRGIPVVCAAGQVERSVLFPAVMKRAIAVGGFARGPGAGLTHYPPGGYNNQARIDTSALAVGLNRPSGFRGPNGAAVPTYASTENPPEKPEGTSYATPFVAAGYAMWFETHRVALTSAAFSGQNAWKRIEAFRRILRSDMPTVMADAGLHGTPDIAIRPLDMPLLLRRAPDADGLEQQPPFRNFAFANEDAAEDYGPMS